MLISWKFASSNQKHCPDLGSVVSLAWNFCAVSSDIISWRKPVMASQIGCCFLRLLAHVITWANLWRTTFLVNFHVRLNRLLIVCHQVVFMYLRVHKVQRLYEAKDIVMCQEVLFINDDGWILSSFGWVWFAGAGNGAIEATRIRVRVPVTGPLLGSYITKLITLLFK